MSQEDRFCLTDEDIENIQYFDNQIVEKVWGNNNNNNNNNPPPGPAPNNGNGNGKERGPKSKQQEKQSHYVQKYTGDNLLAEAVIIGGIPYFAVSELKTNNIRLEKSIAIDDKNEYRPFEPSAYLNKPYKFKSEQEFKQRVEKARCDTLDTIYRKIKAICSKYIDADSFHIAILAADITFTYYQDRMGLTHYLYFVGGNDSGKSNNLLVLNHLAYRNFTSTGMTVANVYQFLGSDEEGQGTLCYDEADKIDEDRPMMAVLKNGNIQGCPVARIDTSFGRKQMKFNTYCWKAFAAERFLDPVTAKGLIQRCIELQCYAGDPQYDIAEVIDSAGADEFQELKEELNEAHNTLLVFKLLHFHEKIRDIKLNIKRREKQLFKPVIRIFQNAEVLDELLQVISKYVTKRREANSKSHHAFLYGAVRDMIKSRKSPHLESSFIWNYIKENLQGQDIPQKPLSYDTSEFGVLTQKEIIQTLEHVFGAEAKKTHGKRMLYFDISKLQRLGKVYDLATEVKVVRDGDDSFEQNRGADWTDWTDVGLGRHLSSDVSDEAITSNDGGNNENYIIESRNDEEIKPSTDLEGDRHAVHPPHPPHPTPAANSNANSNPNLESGNGQDKTFHIKWGKGAIYRFGQSDKHGCSHCRQTGDIHYMRIHECTTASVRGNKKTK